VLWNCEFLKQILLYQIRRHCDHIRYLLIRDNRQTDYTDTVSVKVKADLYGECLSSLGKQVSLPRNKYSQYQEPSPRHEAPSILPLLYCVRKIVIVAISA